jgi:trans-aconitate 2-methyltransferase
VDAWDPQQYERFRAERSAPFSDLLGLLEPVRRPRVVDLGCGTGELTADAHARLGARETVGIDRSPAMLARAAARAGGGLSFRLGDLTTFGAPEEFDVVLSNAALHWVPDHRAVLTRWCGALTAPGQLAVQVPANDDHPAHRALDQVADEEPFASLMAHDAPPDPVQTNVLRPEEYATLLDDLGFARQHVRLQVYGHHLASTAEVVEWVRGTSLNRFRGALDGPELDLLVDRYRARVLEVLGDRRPYFYAFRRILLWGAGR